MSKICIPCTNPEKWKPLLAQPDKHWRSGYSAKTLAYSWSEAKNGFPAEVYDALQNSPHFRDIELLLAIPEHKVSLPGGERPSQNDIWALARSGGELISITVEGKVSEPFDKTVSEWQVDAKAGKIERLEYLAATLELDRGDLSDIRYQLLHRTASALIEARRYSASHAVMLVHSFSKSREHFEDFRKFVSLFGADAKPDIVTSVGVRSGVSLHLVWVTGDARYLDK